MIPARKVRWFDAWFSRHARSRIHATFGEVRARGIESVRARGKNAPLLVVSNHTSWWDPLVALHASKHLFETDGHALMDAKNLRRLPFFALVGAFGVDRESPTDGALAMRYAARLLDAPGKLVWVFPQGEERPITERPLDFRRGSAEIARVARRALVLPVALRYEFGGLERPTLWISCGDPLPAERDTAKGRAAQAQAVEAELDRIDRALGGEGAEAFEVVFRAEPSRVGLVMERMLAAMTRPFVMRARRGARSLLQEAGATHDEHAVPPRHGP